MNAPSIKLKKCRMCQNKFPQFNSLHVVCSPACAIRMAEENPKALGTLGQRRLKVERSEHRQKKLAAKTRQQWLKEVEAVVNRYARLRDYRLGCVSCDKPANWNGQWHASHFRSVGAASAVRFNLWNIHKSCSVCNKWKSGNLSEYEPRLRAKIGDDKVDWLRTQNHIAEYSIEYLTRLKRVFTKKCKLMERKIKEMT